MKNKWTFNSETHALADTGDYESNTLFMNGKDTLQTNSEDIDDEQSSIKYQAGSKKHRQRF